MTYTDRRAAEQFDDLYDAIYALLDQDYDGELSIPEPTEHAMHCVLDRIKHRQERAAGRPSFKPTITMAQIQRVIQYVENNY